MTKKKKYRRYSPQFKGEALKRANAEDVTDIQVCKELGISARQLRRWRDEVRLLGKDAFLGKGHSHDDKAWILHRRKNQDWPNISDNMVLCAAKNQYPKKAADSRDCSLKFAAPLEWQFSAKADV